MTKNVLNARELAQVRRIAQNVDADYQKVCKLSEKIAELTAQMNELQQGIDEQEAPVMRKTGGFKSTDLYVKTIVPQFNEDGTPKTDKDGRQIKVTKYVLRYPDTIIPVEGNTQTVESEPLPSTADGFGSDFDLDKESLQMEAEHVLTANELLN